MPQPHSIEETAIEKAKRVLDQSRGDVLLSTAEWRELVKKHGHQKTSLAAAIVNAEQIYNSMHQNSVPPHIIHAFKEASQHMLTEWGALAKVPQSELQPIVEGFRQHLGILDADLAQALNKGDGNATAKPLS